MSDMSRLHTKLVDEHAKLGYSTSFIHFDGGKLIAVQEGDVSYDARTILAEELHEAAKRINIRIRNGH
jgi:hypothetical protein